MSQAATNQTGEILLEAGTNELEVLVFGLGSLHCGVNVAKVREVLRTTELTRSPGMHPSLDGMFNMRGNLIPVVDLGRHLNVAHAAGRPDASTRLVIVTEFNQHRTGFLVDRVDQIHRLSWTRVRPAPDLGGLGSAGGDHAGICTGLIEMDDRLVLMLDFESVADAISLEEKLHVERIDNTLSVDRASKRVALVEDSPFMRNLMKKVFLGSGYAKLEVYENGEQAWKALSAAADAGGRYDAVVSDIEMPRMDGLHLTKRIKSDPRFSGTPIILFSSLISEDNRKKGQQVGADVQIPKPQLPEMVLLVDRVCRGERVGLAQQPAAAA